MESAAIRFVRRYFAYEHLPPHLQKISQPFCVLAKGIAHNSGAEIQWVDEDEVMAGLRKLLEAKDCIVRAALPERE